MTEYSWKSSSPNLCFAISLDFLLALIEIVLSELPSLRQSRMPMPKCLPPSVPCQKRRLAISRSDPIVETLSLFPLGLSIRVESIRVKLSQALSQVTFTDLFTRVVLKFYMT